MKNQDFTTTILVDQTPQQAYRTILDVSAWWSGLFDESFEGNSEKTGDEFSFRAGQGAHYTRQKLVELVPEKKVTWLVTEANLSFVNKTAEWEGTEISFDISPENNKTRITFTHKGLVPDFECYDACALAWTKYLQERLVMALKN